MRKAKTTKVTLRYRMLESGRQSLYLDFYPAVVNPLTGETSRREYLGMFVTPLRKRNGELQTCKDGSHKYSEEDAETIRLAQIICANRQNEMAKMSIYSDAELEMLKAKERGKQDFIVYFRDMAKQRTGVTHRSWMSTLKHMERYAMLSGKSPLRFCDIDLGWCEGFRDYLQRASNKNGTGVLLESSAAHYLTIFKIALKSAYKHGYLQRNFNEDLRGIKASASHREFLTLDELKSLVSVPCKNSVLKRAALFSSLTGLRFSDIQKMKWGELMETADGITLRYVIKKTNSYDELPVSSQAMRLCGERQSPDSPVFAGLSYAHVNEVLRNWLSAAGITRKITFHCFRHTFATLQLASGTQVTTIQRMLGHKSLNTTMIYAKVLEESKRAAADKLKIF